ncbi:hypothetical protein [Streptomyces sp. CB02923]|uniref:hypothetical protein n=1 Tax=Streptomyces sp. CB02923 TaxID=1718985 RepID=UPI001900173D|nr:hypothetical protein [Streptomyces sp. CB02923]
MQKARRVAGRADAEVDRALDAAMDELHGLVSTRLGEQPALLELTAEAEEQAEAAEMDEGAGTGEAAVPSDPVRQRMQRALADAAEGDAGFAAAVERAVQQVQDARDRTAGRASAEGAGGVAVHGSVNVSAETGGAAAVTMGNVTMGNPPQPGPQHG